MMLNHDCVRDILLYLESIPYDPMLINSKDIELPKYSYEEILYSLKKLKEAGFINMTKVNFEQSTFIESITWSGHDFLDNIRDNKTWRETISKISKTVGSASIDIISRVAVSIINSKLGI